MFNYNNVKYRYLVDSIDFINKRDNIELHNYGGNVFGEFNVIAIGGIRQSGKTLAIQKNFDVNKDIYIAPRKLQVDEFLSEKRSLNNGDLLHSFTKEELVILEKRKAFFSCQYSIERREMKCRISNALVENSVIYLDVYSVEIPDNYKYVDEVIKIMNSLKNSKKYKHLVPKIYLVYT